MWKLHEKFGQQLMERLQQDLAELPASAAGSGAEQLHRFLALLNCYVNLARSIARGAPEALTLPGGFSFNPPRPEAVH